MNILVFFLQKRSRIGFDESDEEMLDLLAVAPGCPIAVTGKSPVAEDARVGPFELIDSGAQGDSSVVEAPEECVDALLGQVDKKAEMPEEHPLQSKSSPKKRL